MNGLIWEVLELAVYIMELGTLYLFLNKNCEKKRKGQIYNASIFILFVLFLSTKGYLAINGLIWLAICFMICVAYTALIFKGSMTSYLLYNGIYVIVIGLCEGVCLGILGMKNPQFQMEQLLTFHDLRYIFTCISKLFAIIILLLISNCRKISINDYSKENMKSTITAFFVSIISLYSLFDIKKNEIAVFEVQKLNQTVCILSLCIFTINIIFYWTINKLNNKLIEEKEYELIQCQNKLLSKAVLDNEEVNNEWRKIRHDFNNHLSCVDMLLQMDNIPKARAYIQKLTHNGESDRLSIHTGHEIVDAVINQKSIIARNDGIQFNVSGEIGRQLHIEDMDLCALLSNSIDNAIEAARQIEDEAKRQIKIQLEEYESYMAWQIINSVKENIDKSKQLRTTKKDVNRHGIGMMSMTTTVEKYNGKIEWRCEDYQFKLSILIPVNNI